MLRWIIMTPLVILYTLVWLGNFECIRKYYTRWSGGRIL